MRHWQLENWKLHSNTYFRFIEFTESFHPESRRVRRRHPDLRVLPSFRGRQPFRQGVRLHRRGVSMDESQLVGYSSTRPKSKSSGVPQCVASVRSRPPQFESAIRQSCRCLQRGILVSTSTPTSPWRFASLLSLGRAMRHIDTNPKRTAFSIPRHALLTLIHGCHDQQGRLLLLGLGWYFRSPSEQTSVGPERRRSIDFLARSEHSTPLLRELHWVENSRADPVPVVCSDVLLSSRNSSVVPRRQSPSICRHWRPLFGRPSQTRWLSRRQTAQHLATAHSQWLRRGRGTVCLRRSGPRRPLRPSVRSWSRSSSVRAFSASRCSRHS